MVKFTANADDGKLLIGLGLSRGNCERLLAKRPIRIQLGELDPRGAGIDVLIFGGETELAMAEELGEFLTAQTNVVVDPKLG